RLLSGQAEVPDEDGVRRIAQVVNLRHARRTPGGVAADQIRDAGLALPPALMRVLQVVHDEGEARRLFRSRHVPDFVAGRAERTKQVELALVRLRQVGAAARAHHLRLTLTWLLSTTRNVSDIFGLPGIGDVDD